MLENEAHLKGNALITEESFGELLKSSLGDTYGRALKIFHNYGPNLSFDVTNVLVHALSQGQEKVDTVIKRLEKHYDKHLAYQDPRIRGAVKDNLLDVNPTQAEFLRICTDVLELKPNPNS